MAYIKYNILFIKCHSPYLLLIFKSPKIKYLLLKAKIHHPTKPYTKGFYKVVKQPQKSNYFTASAGTSGNSTPFTALLLPKQ